MKNMKKILRYTVYVLMSLLFLALGTVLLYWRSDIPTVELKEKYAASPSRFVSVQGMEVHFREEMEMCDSLPIVLLHGTSASLHTWDAWTKELKKKHRIIRLDLPAFGLTGANPTGDYSYQFYVDFLHDFLKKVYIEKCVLVGNSLGGGIAWQFALKHPEVVKKLILVDASGFPSKQGRLPIGFRLAQMPLVNQLVKYVTPKSIVKSSLLSSYGDKSKVTDSLVDRYFELNLHQGNRQALLDRMRQRLEAPDTSLIKRLQMPTLVIWGDQDSLIPVEVAYKFHDALPNDTLVILKGVGHVPMEESPQITIQAVEAFLKKY